MGTCGMTRTHARMYSIASRMSKARGWHGIWCVTVHTYALACALAPCGRLTQEDERLFFVKSPLGAKVPTMAPPGYWAVMQAS